MFINFLLILVLSQAGGALAPQQNSEQGRNQTAQVKPNSLNGEVLMGKVVQLGGKVSSEFQLKITYDQACNSYRASYSSSIYQLNAELDSSLRLRHSKWQAKSVELIKCLGYDQRITDYLPQKEALQITYYQGDKVKETKVVAYDERTLDSDIIYLYLPQVLQSVQEGTSCDVIIKSRGWKLSVIFSPITTTDVLGLTPQYGFLDGFRDFAEKIVEEDEELEVLVMNLNGLSKLFYTHKYYLAFKQTTPRRLVAYWGGAPKEAEFTFIE